MQETFLAIHRARGSFIRGADVVPWAYAIGRRLAIDRQRKQVLESAAQSEPATEVVFHTSPDPGADEWLHAQELLGRVSAELEKMPESQRSAFELIRREGLSHVQAAEALGTTVSAVKLRVHRAYEKLRELLGSAKAE